MDRTLTTRKARASEARTAGKAAGSLLFVPGLHQVGKKFVLLLSLPLNTGFLSTQSENDEKIPLIQKEQLGRICVQFAFFRAPSPLGKELRGSQGLLWKLLLGKLSYAIASCDKSSYSCKSETTVPSLDPVFSLSAWDCFYGGKGGAIILDCSLFGPSEAN